MSKTKTKLVSWNARSTNGDTKQVERLIEDHDPDILCLQEVSPTLLEYLKRLGNTYPFIDCAVDHHEDHYVRRHLPKDYWGMPPRTTAHLVILSKLPFQGEPIKFTPRRKTWRSLEFICGWDESKEYHGVDIGVDGGAWRVVNLHMALSDISGSRLEQFAEVMAHFSHNGHTVVCGDFNTTTTLNLLHLPFFLWRLADKNYSIREMLQGSALVAFSKKVTSFRLHNGFRNKVTHPATGLSLDAILVSKGLEKSLQILLGTDLYGSDHLPLVAWLESPTEKLD